MSSDRCEELLVGLVSGDLGEEQERAARAEIGRCAEHATALRKLDVGMRWAAFLPSVEPRPELDVAILAAARAKVSEPKAATPAPSRHDGLFSRALEVLRRMATGQQLAMSTVMLLVVAIGLWYLPARHEPNADGDTVMAPQLAEEAPRAPAPMPPAAGEPARRDDDRLAQAPAFPGGPKPSPALPPREAAPAAPTTRAPDERTLALRSASPSLRARAAEGARDESFAGGAAPMAETRGPAEVTEPSTESERFDAWALRDETATRGAGRAAAPMSAPAGRAAAPMSSPAAPAAAAPSPAPSAAPAEAASSERSASTGRAADLDVGRAGASAYERGMAAYQAGRYAEAAELFAVVASSGGAQGASALHHLARSRRAAGQCAIAVRDYERLLGGFPAYGQRTQAMIEAADCYQRTGHLADAERWLERAAQSSPSSIAARRELTRVRARRAAGAQGNEPVRAAPRETPPAAVDAY